MLSFLKDLGYRAILLPTPIQIYTKCIRYFAHKNFVSPRAYRACVTRISDHVLALFMDLRGHLAKT